MRLKRFGTERLPFINVKVPELVLQGENPNMEHKLRELVQRNGPRTPAPSLIATVDMLRELHIHPLSLPRHLKATATSRADIKRS